MSTEPSTPIVSVIIPCYNYGHFLAEAIESVMEQSYPAIEILVIDDGSTDRTKEVAISYSDVIYIFQENQGLSAARNKGIGRSKGDYLIFLDADDWLLPEAIALNVSYLEQNSQAAFVAGGHTFVYPHTQQREEMLPAISSHPYHTLLSSGNYIAMIAAVMFARWVFNEILYDTSLDRCEDYDLYLKVTRRYPIVQHHHQIAAYRIHASTMSASATFMLLGALKVLRRQKAELQGVEEVRLHEAGVYFWIRYYCDILRNELSINRNPPSNYALKILLKYSRYLGYNYTLQSAGDIMKAMIKKNIPTFGKRWLYKLGILGYYLPMPGKVASGDFARLNPFSTEFGYDRGGPIDRHYIEKFLQKEAASITGRVLEIGDNAYTLQYGREKVEKSDILHIDASNPKATFIGDLSAAPQVPDDTFNCLILTQTLHLIYDFKGALQTCYRILKPGGILLLTTPGITPIDRGEWKETWYWSFTDKALRRLLTETFPNSSFEISSFGNVYVAAAYLYGMGLPEISEENLNYNDPHFQVINTIKAVKQPALV
jgi:glycosyltransferase involved in cell wall biosynthesis